MELKIEIPDDLIKGRTADELQTHILSLLRDSSKLDEILSLQREILSRLQTPITTITPITNTEDFEFTDVSYLDNDEPVVFDDNDISF